MPTSNLFPTFFSSRGFFIEPNFCLFCVLLFKNMKTTQKLWVDPFVFGWVLLIFQNFSIISPYNGDARCNKKCNKIWKQEIGGISLTRGLGFAAFWECLVFSFAENLEKCRYLNWFQNRKFLSVSRLKGIEPPAPSVGTPPPRILMHPRIPGFQPEPPNPGHSMSLCIIPPMLPNVFFFDRPPSVMPTPWCSWRTSCCMGKLSWWTKASWSLSGSSPSANAKLSGKGLSRHLFVSACSSGFFWFVFYLIAASPKQFSQ